MNAWKMCGIALGIGVSSEMLYFAYKWFRKRRLFSGSQFESESRDSDLVEEVLFFPDYQVACKDYFIGEDGCENRRCKFTHEHTSLSRLYEFLIGAKRTLDVCVFVICCADLADILIIAHKKNVLVRVICDDEQIDITGSQIWKLRKEGLKLLILYKKTHVMLVLS